MDIVSYTSIKSVRDLAQARTRTHPQWPIVEQDRWENVAPMEKARYGCALGVASADGALLVIGGLEDTKSYHMEMYVAGENRWTVGPGIPQRFINVRSATAW
ncbi:hypothetical protein EVAR_52125_1 [Eumeta japonica]|uniref:Uncharacterized protein n=1 Tax=Eumeta variegata TaxID=151549 RepID=A0A4C1XNE4_EUMVA|nr:hypothetical protein EVAR_52125_1 [Eumeta japonica]